MLHVSFSFLIVGVADALRLQVDKSEQEPCCWRRRNAVSKRRKLEIALCLAGGIDAFRILMHVRKT